MLIAAFILVISTAALIQFAVFTWRAGLLRVASEPILDQSEADSGKKSRNLLNGKDFKKFWPARICAPTSIPVQPPACALFASPPACAHCTAWAT